MKALKVTERREFDQPVIVVLVQMLPNGRQYSLGCKQLNRPSVQAVLDAGGVILGRSSYHLTIAVK